MSDSKSTSANMIGVTFGLQLVIAVAVGYVAAAACLVASFFGLGGWGVALAVWLWLNSQIGYKLLTMIGFESRTLNNRESSFAFVIAVQFGVGALLAFDPPGYSAWWALLMPLWIVPSLLIAWATNVVFDAINPAGRHR